ncbi:MAG: type I restriction enzyme S subunit, partial [Verrucomicrobiales bacterium]
MSAFPKYDQYKDSDVEWLGQIPQHWDVERARYIFRKEERPPTKGDGVVTAYRDGQVTLRTLRRAEGYTVAILEHGYQAVRNGDLVIHGMDAFAGAIGVAEASGKWT